MSTTTPTLDANEIARLNSLAEEIDISTITIGERIRRNFDHVPALAETIREEGLIQPIVLTYDRRLIAGESRIRAFTLLGYTKIRAVFRGVLDEAQLTVLEATENNARTNLTWQERILSVDKVHRLRSTQAALSGESWGVRETGTLLRQGKSNIGLAVYLADFLHRNDEQVWKAESAQEAYRILAKRKEDEANALLAKLTIPQAKPVVKYTGPAGIVPAPTPIPTVSDATFLGITSTSTGFDVNLFDPSLDDEAPGATPSTTNLVVPLSQMFLKEENEDSLQVLSLLPSDSFDGCITDWPYAIDMNNFIQDVSSTAKEHDVKKNLTLQQQAIPQIYRILKLNTFFVTWMDITTWESVYQQCVEVGFKVQRWPLIWHKTSACANQAAQFNTTKNYEIAIVCRKGAATLVTPQSSSIWTGGNDIEAKASGHPFAKPFGLWDWVYGMCTKRGDSVLDPFVGRGSSTIPAIRRGLRPTGVECNTEHYNALIVNVSNYYKSLDPKVTFQ